jgi:molecular chaperone GrpE
VAPDSKQTEAMSDVETPRIEPVPESAGLPADGMPSPDETADGLLPGDQAGFEELAADLELELPEDPEDAISLLIGAVAEARGEAGEYLAVMQRVAADFDNYRKRVERDHAENINRASQRVMERLLPALDSFDAALAYEPKSPAEDKILDGMRGTHSQLMEILDGEGLSPIPALGEAFDPKVHEAVAGPQEDGDGSLVVAQELRRGYTMRGRVVRPSLVVVERA